MLEDRLGIFIDASSIDFNEYMLYVALEGVLDDKNSVRTYDISEVAYNKDNVVVKIDYQDSELIEPEDNKW